MDEEVDYDSSSSSEEEAIPMLDSIVKEVDVVVVEKMLIEPVVNEPVIEKIPTTELEFDEEAFLRMSNSEQRDFVIALERRVRLTQCKLLHKVFPIIGCQKTYLLDL